MELYNVPNRTFVRLLEDARVPPGAPSVMKGESVFFRHIDGMYSYCIRVNPPQEVVHIAAWTEVEIVDLPPLKQKE